VNGEVARRYPPLIEMIISQGHEIAAHGMSTDHIHYDGLKTTEENTLIQDSLASFSQTPKGWLSPARTQSSKTLECLAKTGVKYCLDWEMDQNPVTVNMKDGDITLIPNNYELSDFTLLHTRHQTEESWLSQIQNALDLLSEEHTRFGGQMLGLTLTPYVLGQPFRIWALHSLLAHIKDRAEITVFTAAEIDTQFRAQI